jgi:hypothetical protein
MNTAEIMRLIRQGELHRGAYTVDVKPGAYGNVLGNKILVYTDRKPDSDILSFHTEELLIIIESAKALPVNAFQNLITAKRVFGGTIQEVSE